MKNIIAFVTLQCLVIGQPTQALNPTQQGTQVDNGPVPIFRVTVVSRTTKAINYHHRSGSTMVGLQGTALLPKATGEARVESKQGTIKIDANMSKLSPATQFGPEYLTYVMWAITPEGRATNIGEVLLNGDKSHLNVTSELQSFGLIVTAEPYFAVTQPSDVVVMENFIRKDTTGTIEDLNAKFELLPRGLYTLNVKPTGVQPMLNPKIPLELHEARNAVRIARWAGADRYAQETFHKAEIGLLNAEGYLTGKAGKKPIGTVAREAVQMAEDARIISIKKQEEEALSNERTEAAARETRANQQADTQARLRSQAEADRLAAERETERTKAQAEAARMAAQAESERAMKEKMQLSERLNAEKLQLEQARTAAQADSERAAKENMQLSERLSAEKLQLEQARMAAQKEAERAASERAQLEQARAAALEQQQLAKAETATAKASLAEADRLRMQAEADKEQLRKQLITQFNVILETRDSARGLIVNMSDVLFDTGKYTLTGAAREKLAKVSGIILGHPGLKIEVEGHTDSVGGDSYNQKLSEQRSAAVLEYLVKQGLPGASVTSKGFGKTMPVASNDTAAGRQRNRRVELVVSGEIIGTSVSSTQR